MIIDQLEEKHHILYKAWEILDSPKLFSKYVASMKETRQHVSFQIKGFIA